MNPAAEILGRWRSLTPPRRRTLLGLAFGAISPFISGAVASGLESGLGVHAPNMVFLCGVILTAIWFGRRIALAAALFAFFVYNFYLVEPHYTFGLVGLEDVLTLLVFVGVALMLGGLAGNLHDARQRAEEQVSILSGLLAATRPLSECASEAEALRLLAAGAQELGVADAAVFSRSGEDYVANVAEKTSPALEIDPSLARDAALAFEGAVSSAHERGWQLQPILVAGRTAAVLAWRTPAHRRGDQQTIAMRLLSERTGAAIERVLHQQKKIEMDTLAATEKLRGALLSSISHDFRTPLATILASSSSLQTYSDQFSEATRTDLLVSIQEEAEALSRFVDNIMAMNRLDAGVLTPRQEWVDPVEIIDSVEERTKKRMVQHALVVDAPAAAPAILVDPMLVEQALVNVIENALVHTPPNSTITLGVSCTDTAVELWVQDNGPGLAAKHLPHIFDKFYRATNTEKSGGSGLGLAISRGFIEAMNGEAAVQSPAANGRGVKVSFKFKLQPEFSLL